MNEVNLKTLARRNPDGIASMAAPRRHWISRYVLPGAIVAGFASLTLWATRDVYLPHKTVMIMSVQLRQTEGQTEGTPLFKAAGWVEPRPTPIRVAALASGVVEQLLVVEDQAVEVGEPIARLVSIDAELELQQAEALLALREAEVTEAQANLEAARTNLAIPAHLELIVAEADAELAAVETALSNLPQQLEQAKARLRLAEVDRKAREQAKSALSTVEVAEARSLFDSAKAEVQELTSRQPVLEQQRDALRRRRHAAMQRLELKTDEKQAMSMGEARLAAAAARQAESKTIVDQARLRLERMTIRAPVAGRVLQLLTSPGSQLMTGPTQMEKRDANTLITMYQPDRLQARVDVRFEDLPRVVLNQPVAVHSPALAQPLAGRVLFLTGFANIQKNTLEVKVSLESPPEVIKPEMLVDVTFLAPPQLAKREDVVVDEYRILVPQSVVHNDEQGSYVYLADLEHGLARKQPVTVTRPQAGGLCEVASGLNEASRVIVAGTEGLRDGDRITIQDQPAIMPPPTGETDDAVTATTRFP